MASNNQEEKELREKLAQLEKRYQKEKFEESEVPIPESPKDLEIKEELPEVERPDDLKLPDFVVPKIIPKLNFKKSEKKEELPEVERIESRKYRKKSKKKKKVEKEKLKKIKLPRLKRKKVPEIEKKLEEEEKRSKIKSEDIKKCLINIEKLKKEMAKILVGQEYIVDSLIMGLLCNAHILLEGVPGIAKTLAIRALASASGCTVKRIQFTVDMLPTDIIGVTNYTPEKGFEIIKGPIFANFLIADEINRAPPKTQSALIEGMQEKQVTIGREKFHLPNPFFVMATENPIENAGVYPLPEAQIDRFLFKVIMGYPKPDEEKKIMGSNMTIKKFEDFGLKPVITPKDILFMQKMVGEVYVDENIKNYILAIVTKTRNRDFENSQYISYGSSPRASIGIFIASKANALMNGRDFVLPEDVKNVVYDVLRHRLILSYKATIQKISPDLIIKEILNSVSIE